MRPTIAAVNCSLAAWIFSGFPCETINLYPDIIIMIIAIPPITPNMRLNILVTKPPGFVLIEKPNPVEILQLLFFIWLSVQNGVGVFAAL
jgi:hypothetical protein